MQISQSILILGFKGYAKNHDKSTFFILPGHFLHLAPTLASPKCWQISIYCSWLGWRESALIKPIKLTSPTSNKIQITIKPPRQNDDDRQCNDFSVL